MNRSEARRLRELEWERAALRTALERERRRLSDLEERRRELEARHREDLERIAQLSQAIDARCAQDGWNLGLRAREIEQEIARYGDSELASLVSRAREVVESARREQQAVQVQLNTAEAKLRDIMRRDAHNAGAIVRGIEGVLASTGDSELAQMQGSNPIETQKIEAERLHRRLRQLRLEAERRALAADIYEREVVKRRTSKPRAEIQAIDSEATTLRAQVAETERRLNAVEAEIAELQTYRPDAERIPAGRQERKFPLGCVIAISWVLGVIVMGLGGALWGSPISPILVALGMGLSWGVPINWLIQGKPLGAPFLLIALVFYVLFLLAMPSLSPHRGASQAIESMQVTQIGADPRVVSVSLPSAIASDGKRIAGSVRFEAPGRNLRVARFEVVRAQNFAPFSFDPGVYGQAAGTFKFYVYCNTPQKVTLRLTLRDADGRESTPRQFSFSCRERGGAIQWPASPPPPAPPPPEPPPPPPSP
jgi:hypothetical protein